MEKNVEILLVGVTYVVDIEEAKDSLYFKDTMILTRFIKIL